MALSEFQKRKRNELAVYKYRQTHKGRIVLRKIKRYLLTAEGKAEKSRTNREYREKNREYDIQRKAQYRIKKAMKKSTLSRTDYKSEQDIFQVTVETEDERPKNSEREISISRIRGGGSFYLKNKSELLDLMVLLSEFSEEWEKIEPHKSFVKPPKMLVEEVQEDSKL